MGSELLTPDYNDTNSLYLTRGLNEVGVQVHLKSIVGDDEEDLVGVLRAALQRSDLILFSGGLGPTEDDRTRRSVARVLNRPIHVDPEILDHIRQLFSSRGYSMPSINERQAEVIEGAEILRNEFGTAPGMWLDEKGVYIALLPGPPREIKPMFDSEILPRVRRLSGRRRMARRSFFISGMTESQVDAQAAPIYKTYPRVQTTILAGTSHISLHLSQWLEPGEPPSDLEELSQRICECFRDAIFSSKNESLEEVIGVMLQDSGCTLAVAESCTAGMLGARITRVAGSSAYFLGGVVCYSDDAKQKLCGVSPLTLRSHGAVSAEVAMALASGIRQNFLSTYGLSITGIAGPSGGTPEKPVGLVFVGLADDSRTEHVRRILPGDRDAIRERATAFALSSFRKFILSEDKNKS